MRLRLADQAIFFEAAGVLYIVKIKLLSPWLGSVYDNQHKVRCFRTVNNRVPIDREAWCHIFRHAKDNLSLTCDTNLINWPMDFEAPSIHAYVKWKNRVAAEYFQCFRKGTVITLDFTVNHVPNAPTQDDLNKLWQCVGRYGGISDFGNHFGYGRFTLQSLEPSTITTPA